MANISDENQQVAVQATVSTGPVAQLPGTDYMARRVIIKSPTVQYVKSRFAHRAAIRQWKLSKIMLGRRPT